MSDSTLDFIDAHHHLWDLSVCHYPWLMARGVERFFGDPTPIQKNYLVEDLLSESRRFRPRKSVHIQVGVVAEQSLRESRWLQETAGRSEDAGFPHGIVAFADLSATDAEAQLDQQQSIRNVRGIRQIVGRHASEDESSGTGGLLYDAVWRQNLAALAGRKLSFDLQLTPPQTSKAFEVLSAVPDLKVALCHCGSPWDQSDDGLAHWRRGLRQLASLPNVYCKISGLGMFNRNWNTEDLRPIILDCIDIFGVSRCMFGSNFPVDRLYRSYAAYWEAYDQVTGQFSRAERDRLFHGTASAFYQI